MARAGMIGFVKSLDIIVKLIYIPKLNITAI